MRSISVRTHVDELIVRCTPVSPPPPPPWWMREWKRVREKGEKGYCWTYWRTPSVTGRCRCICLSVALFVYFMPVFTATLHLCLNYAITANLLLRGFSPQVPTAESMKMTWTVAQAWRMNSAIFMTRFSVQPAALLFLYLIFQLQPPPPPLLIAPCVCFSTHIWVHPLCSQVVRTYVQV